MKKINRENQELWETNATKWNKYSDENYNIHRDFLDSPSFLKLLDNHLENLHGLEIGCGEGYYSRLIRSKCASLIATDVSESMISFAKGKEKENPLNIKYIVMNALDLKYLNNSFDFVISAMSLMDIPDPQIVIEETYRVLKPGGYFFFSITHPCFSPPQRKHILNAEGKEIGLEIGRYNDEGKVQVSWNIGNVEEFTTFHYHLTLSAWLNLLSKTNYYIEKTIEPYADLETVERCPHLEHTRNVPNIIMFQCRKNFEY